MRIHVRAPVIYKITNMINQKIYIGQTVDFDRRVNEYKSRNPNILMSSNYAIMQAINHYGVDNFKFEILHTCRSRNELNEKEYYYINLYKSYDPRFGYNSKHNTTDGEKCNNVTREKMSNSHIGLKEKSSTKLKKSKPIIAINNVEMIVCDSAKLFADYVHTSRAVVSHACRDRTMIRGYYIFSADIEIRSSAIKRSKNEKYKSLGNMLNNEDVETIKNQYIIKYLRYTDE